MREVWTVLTCTLLAAAPAAGQTPATLTLNDAIAASLAANPEIAAARQLYEAARSRPGQARSLPDPMVTAGYSSNGRPWPGAGLGEMPTANIGAMVSQELPYPGKRDLRAAVAAREAEADAQEVEAARLSVTSRVKQAYYRLSYTYAAEDVLVRNRDLLNTLLQVSETRYAVGGAAQQDVIKAQTQVSILELQLERVRQERAASEGELNALMARPAGSPVGRAEDLRATPFDMTLDSLMAAAQEHAPMLRRDQILLDRSTLAIDAARKDYKPDFGIRGGYYYMGSMSPMFELRVDVQLPLRRAKRAAAIAEQRSLANAAKSTYEAGRLSLQGRLSQDYQMTVTAARLARLYRETVLPQARLALESSMASYQTGGVDFLSVLTNFGTVLEYEMTYFDELASYHVAVSRLEEMTGTALAH
jgi:outer membrane protein, heavy metal efflux system